MIEWQWPYSSTVILYDTDVSGKALIFSMRQLPTGVQQGTSLGMVRQQTTEYSLLQCMGTQQPHSLQHCNSSGTLSLSFVATSESNTLMFHKNNPAWLGKEVDGLVFP